MTLFVWSSIQISPGTLDGSNLSEALFHLINSYTKVFLLKTSSGMTQTQLIGINTRTRMAKEAKSMLTSWSQTSTQVRKKFFLWFWESPSPDSKKQPQWYLWSKETPERHSSAEPQPHEPVSRIAQATLLKQPPPATPRPPHILTFVRSYASLQKPKICLESHHFFRIG